jgi:glycosyltransferase involved in cell wall biosynthesis
MKVSVCIPTVSRINFLRDALKSVDEQTFRDCEVVISENAATAEYARAVDALASEFPNLQIRIHHQPRQLSMASNANFLIDVARGDYWIYLPDDDRQVPQCLEVLVEALDINPQAGFAFGDHWIINASGQVDERASDANSHRYGRDRLAPGFYSRSELFDLALFQVFQLQSMMFRTAVIRDVRFREESGPIPDYDLQLRLWTMKGSDGAIYCAERLNEYRVHGNMSTATAQMRERLVAQIRSLERCSPPERRSSRRFRRTLAQCYAGLSLCQTQAADMAAARKSAMRALILDSLRLRVIATAALSLMPAVLARSIYPGL